MFRGLVGRARTESEEAPHSKVVRPNVKSRCERLLRDGVRLIGRKRDCCLQNSKGVEESGAVGMNVSANGRDG